MRYCFDFDGTITQEVVVDLKDAKPNKEMIKKINSLWANWHDITIFTSRGMLSVGHKEGAEKKYGGKIEQLLNKWNVCYDKLVFGKVSADAYVDDLGISVKQITRPNVLVGKLGRKVFFDIESMGDMPGNYEIMGMVEILRQFCNVYMFGDYDKKNVPDNVFSYEHKKHKDIIDYVFLDNGIVRGQSCLKKYDRAKIKDALDLSARMINIVNDLWLGTNPTVFYSLTDPRLKLPKGKLDAKYYTLHQNEKDDLKNRIIRGHQEKLCLLNLPFVEREQKVDNAVMLLARNDPVRNKELIKAIKHISKLIENHAIHVYGNFKKQELGTGKRIKYMGEVKPKDLGKVYSEYVFNICVPIRKGWLTQKVMETFHYGCSSLGYNYDAKNLRTENYIPYYRLDTWVKLYKEIMQKVE